MFSRSLILSFSGAIISLGFCATTSAIQAPEANSQKLDEFAQLQSKCLAKELQFIKTRLGLDEGTITAIKNSLESETAEAAIRIGQLESKSWITFHRTQLDAELEMAFWQACQNCIPESKKNDVTSYVSGAKQLRLDRNRNNQFTVLRYLDGLVSFSDEQRDAITSLLEENWQLYWQQNVDVLLTGSTDKLDPILESFGDDKLRELLDDEQFDVINNRSRLYIGLKIQKAEQSRTACQQDTEGFRDLCERVMRLHVAQIDRRYNLDEKQKRLFYVANKKSINELVENWQDIATRADINPGRADVFLEIVKATAQTIPSQCRDKKVWQQTLKKTLSTDQLERYQQIAKKHSATMNESLLSHLIYTAIVRSGGVKLDHDQFLQVKTVLDEQLADRNLEDYFDAMLLFAKVDDEKLNACFDQDQWDRVEKSLDRVRQFANTFEQD